MSRNADSLNPAAFRQYIAAMVLVFLTTYFGKAGIVLAERADRDKPVNIEADRMNADDAKKTAVFEGHVLLTQGTMTLRADRVTVRQDRDGFQHGIAIGTPALFRQKREGCEEYVEAQAARIEYDARADRVEFFDGARLRREGGDDVRGNYISYDARTEQFTVNAGQQAGRIPPRPGERVQAVIQPRNSPTGSSDCGPKPTTRGGRADQEPAAR